jgi:hypothetical protein
MPELFAPTLADQIAEIERELKMRRSAYPRLIAESKLSKDRADRQLAVMEAALSTLRGVMADCDADAANTRSVRSTA